jgi:prevent-host-death family protein
MDKYVSATEANQRFSEILREVSEGESFAVLSRGKVVANITPAKKREKKKSTAEFLAELEKFPVRVIGPWTREELYDRSDRDIP